MRVFFLFFAARARPAVVEGAVSLLRAPTRRRRHHRRGARVHHKPRVHARLCVRRQRECEDERALAKAATRRVPPRAFFSPSLCTANDTGTLVLSSPRRPRDAQITRARNPKTHLLVETDTRARVGRLLIPLRRSRERERQRDEARQSKKKVVALK